MPVTNEIKEVELTALFYTLLSLKNAEANNIVALYLQIFLWISEKLLHMTFLNGSR